MIPIPGNISSSSSQTGAQGVGGMHPHQVPHPPLSQLQQPNFSMQSSTASGQKRSFMDISDMQHPGVPAAADDGNGGEKTARRKGRKKSPIWSHTILTDTGKVHCKHCNAEIRVHYGEKVERLRRHFVKACTKSPFHKDSKEYEELLESVNAPQQESKKKSFVNSTKTKNNRVLSYSIGFVATILGSPTMELTKEQIAKLEAQGNRSSNWAGVKITSPASIALDSSLERIRGCYFGGNIFIGVFVKNTTLAHSVSVPSGLYNSNFTGTCVLSDSSYVFNCSTVCNVFLGRNSSLVNCAQVVCEGNTSYGTQRTICVGSESANGRAVSLAITNSFHEVCALALAAKKPSADLVEGLDNDWAGSKTRKAHRINRSDDAIRYDMTIICDDTEIAQCVLVRNAFVGSYSRIKSSSVDSCTLLSHCSVSLSECTDVVMHGSCSVASKCACNGVLMFPHSSVLDGAKVEECVLGPDSSVGVGECKRSLVGPFVGFHHQSLLISTLWMMGRGNIAYGAMIGANHTGRTNDQESIIGEGCFFGLATSAQFPFNLAHSPYSMIASNTQCQPQKISFPFSLISNCDVSNERGQASRNMLRPAWVLWSNAYFVERSAMKFGKRRKSIEYRTDFPVFRPSIVDLVVDARNRLVKLKRMQAHAQQDDRTILRVEEQHLPGVGQCFIMSSDIDRAVDAYTNFVRRYALHGLLFLLATADNCATDPEISTSYVVDIGVAPISAATVDPGMDSDSEDDPGTMARNVGQRGGLGIAALPTGMTGLSAGADYAGTMGMGLAGSGTMMSMLLQQQQPLLSLSQQQPQQQPQQQQQQQQQQQGQTLQQQAAVLPHTLGYNAPAGPHAALLEDLRRMELHSGHTIEDFMIRSEQRRGVVIEGVTSSNKRAIIEYANSTHGNHVLGALLSRTGSCCLLTDSHVFAVRCHQLRILMEEFPGVDFVSILDACPRGGVLASNPAIAPVHYEKLRQLLQLAVDLERSNVDNIRQGRRKDFLRAGDVIGPAVVDAAPLTEEDEVVQRARCRLEDVNLCVHRLVSQLHA